ncbi:hypothetical protein Ddc_24048 [Ditylenchus destructor]|nr:hypothetical protein Ddc_24048 [Ditylenchus destructor]
MAVVSANLEVLCDAIAVTDQHLLTSRECILPVLKTLYRTVSLIFVMHRNCLKEECAKYPMEHIGYSYSHDFAIIQLRSASNREIVPACFSTSDGVEQLYNHEDGYARQLRAYGKILTLVEQSDFVVENQTTAEICRKDEYFCSSPAERQCNEKEPLSKLKSGAGILDMHTFSLLGMKIDRRGSYGQVEQNAEVFRRADKLLTALCFYLNRCDQESYLFKNAIYHFSKFYAIK